MNNINLVFKRVIFDGLVTASFNYKNVLKQPKHYLLLRWSILILHAFWAAVCPAAPALPLRRADPYRCKERSFNNKCSHWAQGWCYNLTASPTPTLNMSCAKWKCSSTSLKLYSCKCDCVYNSCSFINLRNRL